MRVVLLMALTVALGASAAVAQVDLFTAARQGSVEDVRNALTSGADVNAVDADGFTPLLLAVHFNSADVVEALLDAGADPDAVNALTGFGVFAYVWRNPQGAAVRDLLDARGLAVSVRASPSPPTAPPSDGDPHASTPGPAGGPPSATPAARSPSQPAQRVTAAPFAISQLRSHWTRAANVLGDNALIVPEVRFMLRNDQTVEITRLTVRAEFYLRDASGALERLGNATSYVVGSSDVPMRPGVQEEVRLRSGVGFVDNNSARVRDIKRGVPPATLVELYYRTGTGDWTLFTSFDVDAAYR